MAQIGDRIGPFELIECLSLGTRMSLYRARRADGSDREPREAIFRVAIDPADAELQAALQREYEALRAMQDDRLQRAWGLYAGHGALALEYVHGTSLQDVLTAARKGTVDLDLATTLDIIVEVAYALRHAHAIVREEGRIVHGHLSPSSVWLEPSGQVRVVGFAAPDRPTGAAPEQDQGAVADPRSDQWSLGRLALTLLCEVDEATQSDPVEDDADMLARLERTQPGIYRVLARMLAHAAEDRWEPEERMLKELLSAARLAGGVSHRVEIAARVFQVSPGAVVSRPPSVPPAAGPSSDAPDARATEPSEFQGVSSPDTEEVPVVPEPEPELPPWKRVRRNSTLAATLPPAPSPSAPLPHEEPARIIARRPTVEGVPDWVAIATILLLLVAGGLALIVRFG